VPRYNDSRLRLCKRCAHRARRSNDEERETYGDTFTDVHRPIASAATRAFNIKPAIGGGLKKRRKEEQTPDICLPSCSRMRKFSFNAIACPFPSNYAPAWLWAARPEIISLDSRARSSSRRAFLLPAWMLNPKLNFRSNHDPASKFQSLNKLSIFRDVCLFRAGFNSFGVRGSGGRIHRDPRHMDGKRSVNERALHACYKIVNQVAHLRLKSERVDAAVVRRLKRQRASKRIAIVYSGRVRHKCFNSNPVGIWTYRWINRSGGQAT